MAAILAGVLYFAGQAGELVFSSSNGGDAVFVALGIAGIIALGVAVWGLRDIVSGTRRGRIGIRIGVARFARLGLFAIQVIVEQVRRVGYRKLHPPRPGIPTRDRRPAPLR